MPLAPNEVYRPPDSGLPPITDVDREIVARANARRIALQGDMQLLRVRYEEIMRWINPPWDAVSRRVDPRGELATTERSGENILHVDLVHPVVDRWSVLQMGAAPVFRVKPAYVAPPVPGGDPERLAHDRSEYEIDTAIAQLQSSQMENLTGDWMTDANAHRTLLWACWSKEAFGKGILKSGWDPVEKRPTLELYENPSTVYYGWTKRYGTRRLAWAMVIDEMDPAEANRRFGITLPTDPYGNIDLATWTGLLEQGDMDQRPEQQQTVQQYVAAEEYWELTDTGARYALILAGRVIQGPTVYPWKRLPFHVFENSHIPTWMHGKSAAEAMIPINAAFDDMLDREHTVIEFEAGPRYLGLNMDSQDEEVDIPPPFHLLPLRTGEDVRQLDTRVDFFPSQLHGNQLLESTHRATGLTPIAWGMSPNAQTSGRAMSAEWRAVELPMTGKLINMGPEIRDIFLSWWDYAEAYDANAKKLGQGYRRFEVLWVPLDIRDKTEKTTDILNRLAANIIDPETAIQESGYENVDEILARIKRFLIDPIWNPLRYQQYLTLQQLELTIRQQQLQVQMMEQQLGAAGTEAQPGMGAGVGGAPRPGGGVAPDELAAQGANAAGQAAQQIPTGGGEAMNQPGQLPGALPLDTSILSQTPLGAGGIGNRAVVQLSEGGPVPTGGVVAR